MEEQRATRALDYYQRMIDGHVYIRETIDTFLATLAARVGSARSAPRILELGSHAGFLSETILSRWPEAHLLVVEDDPKLLALAEGRLASSRVDYHPSLTSVEPVDVVISLARHHHLPHGYLSELRAVMGPNAVYVVGDELCPEYCAGAQLARIEGASALHIYRGYVFTDADSHAAFVSGGSPSEQTLELERLRQRALWRWYRFVVDEAVERGYFDVAAAELRSAHDDLITGSDAEHKFSPVIVERQFSLAGYRQLSKRLIGPLDDPERQSMFVYEYALS